MRLIANANNVCNFDEFLKALRWLASQDKPCKGCRFGGGWSWDPGCLVRNCCAQKGIDFCYQCEDFPCKELNEEPLLDRKKTMIEAIKQVRTMGIESWMRQLKKKYIEAAIR